jgi:hypothetical protein
VRLGLCCCGDPGTEPEPGLCGTTSTVPQPWPDRIYTLDISGDFGTVMQRVTIGDLDPECPGGEPEPNCREEPLAFYWLEDCCDDDGFYVGTRRRKVLLQGDTTCSGSFEFDSRGRRDDNANCTRQIPVSASNVKMTTPICVGGSPASSVQVNAIYDCSKPITNCATGVPDFGARCLDVSMIEVSFWAYVGAHYTYKRYCSEPATQECWESYLVGKAVYKRAKSATDTHVAVGAYSLVWSESPYGDGCGTGNPTIGCPGDSPFPRVITVGIKP